MITKGLLAILVFGIPANSGISDILIQNNTHIAIYQSQPLELINLGNFLHNHGVNNNIEEISKSILTSSKKYNLDTKLLASILVVESRGNPLAISNHQAVGLMQIHIPTWGSIATNENVNLFKIPDNIDFGARIFKQYLADTRDIWQALKRYNGCSDDDTAYTDAIAKVYK